MSSAFSARRRAEQFDALVGAPAAGVDDARFADLLEVVGALRAVPAPAPRADFSASLREQLLAEADTVLLPRSRSVDDRLTLPSTTRTPRSRRDRRLAVAAGTLAVVGASTSMAMAAQTALPGESLYPVKRALEDAHAEVSVGDGAKGTTLLANASGRLDELAELARLDTPRSTAAAPGTLDVFTEQTEEAARLLMEDYTETGNAASITELRDFTSASMSELARLEGALEPSAQEALRSAAELLARIDAAAARLCPTCGGSGITDVPLALLGAASTSYDELTAPSRTGDRVTTLSTEPAGRRRAEAPAPAGTTDSLPVAGAGTGPGSILAPATSGGAQGGGTGAGSTSGGSDGGAGDGSGLADLLAGSPSTTSSGGGRAPATDAGDLLEPLDPLTDPVTGLVDEALGTDLTD